MSLFLLYNAKGIWSAGNSFVAAVNESGRVCTKCGSGRFNSWNRCMDCRNARAKLRTARLAANGGKHTGAQWHALLAASPVCAECKRPWADIPARPDPRYKTVWTKGHKIAVYHGGTDENGNIQAECYECNTRAR